MTDNGVLVGIHTLIEHMCEVTMLRDMEVRKKGI